MNITVTADKSSNDKVVVTVTVPATDVDAAIDGAYKDIARKYAFQGFRRGRAPRPVINSIVGKQAVLAQATEDLMDKVQPQMLDELDLVAIAKPEYPDAQLVEEHKDFTTKAEVAVPPHAELDSYDAPTIKMPPEHATDAEIARQLEQIRSYNTKYEDDKSAKTAQATSVVVLDVKNKEGLPELEGTDRQIVLDSPYVPSEFAEGVAGMKVNETKEISWTRKEDDHETPVSVSVTLKTLKKSVVPELTDEFAKTSTGFDTLEKLKEAIKDEIEKDKVKSLPALKEDRVVEAIGEHLTLEEVPEVYQKQVFSELANEFLSSLQRQGATLDMYLASRGIKSEDFLADLHEQAKERARQSLALNAIATKLGLEATEEDVINEFKDASADYKAAMKQFKDNGQMPAIRESIRRTKAVKWLVENAKVEVVDEAELAQKEEEKAKKSTAHKSTKKVAPKKAAAKKPAAKKESADAKKAPAKAKAKKDAKATSTSSAKK